MKAAGSFKMLQDTLQPTSSNVLYLRNVPTSLTCCSDKLEPGTNQYARVASRRRRRR